MHQAGLNQIQCFHWIRCRVSSVGIAARYVLDGPGIESRWRIFRTRPDRLWGPPSLLYNGYRGFPEGKEAGVWRWPAHLAPRLNKEKRYTSTPRVGIRGLFYSEYYLYILPFTSIEFYWFETLFVSEECPCLSTWSWPCLTLHANVRERHINKRASLINPLSLEMDI